MVQATDTAPNRRHKFLLKLSADLWVQERIGFYDITDIVQTCMEKAEFVQKPDLDAIFAINDETLVKAKELISKTI